MSSLRSGYLYQKVKGGVWYVRWMIDGKVFIRSTGETTQKGAEAKRRQIMAPFAVGSELDLLQNVAGRISGQQAELSRIDEQEHPPLKIADAWEAYEQTSKRPDSGEGTLAMYKGQWARFAAWSEQNYPKSSLRDVDEARAQAYADDLAKAGFSANTFSKHLGLLALVFRSLAREGRIGINPWDDIQRKRAATHSRRELTIEELRRVCTTATGELRTLLAIGLYSGLRLGDAATLRWAEVDMERGEIRRIPNKTGRHNPKPVIVPLHPTLAALLDETPKSRRHGPVLPGLSARYEERRDDVTSDIQRHLWNCGISCHAPGTGWQIKLDAEKKPVLTKAGNVQLEQVKSKKSAVLEVGFHSLRHSFVSLCRSANVPLSVVESIVGHASPAMTRHYTHVGEEAAKSAVNMLPDINADAVDAKATKTVDGKAVRMIGDGKSAMDEVVRLAKALTVENLEVTRTALLALAKV